MSKLKIITTSWDDGNVADLKILDLLNKYNLKGTFYIPKICEYKSLTDEQLRLISKSQEIGAHTLDHLNLKALDKTAALGQIKGSKAYLEQLLGRKINAFCYPGGDYKKETVDLVKDCGFVYSRTIKRFCLDFPDNLLEAKTTISVSPQIKNTENKGQSLRHYFFRASQNLIPIFNFKFKTKISLKDFHSWELIALKAFEYVSNHGGVLHLWGHSWSVEKYNLWPGLEEVFKKISNKKDFKYIYNSELANFSVSSFLSRK